MTRYLDITGILEPGLWSYDAMMPGLVPPFEQKRWATIDEQGFENDWFAMPTLYGTYLETAKHIEAGAPSIDEVPVDKLFLNASIAVIPKEPLEHITAADLETHVRGLEPGDALLFTTGWDKHWQDDGSTFVMKSPHFDLPALEWIIEHGVSILGGDVPCFDDPRGEEGQGVLIPFFGGGGIILAPLVRLAEWGEPRARLTVLPVPLKDSCGAPCRAVLSTI